MRVVVDTSVWSLAFRRKAPARSREIDLLADLIQDGRVVLLGVVRQELLSGIRLAGQFEQLRQKLSAFPDPLVEREDYETAAAHFNTCMTAGVQGSAIDFLISAFAARRGYQIFTTDPDFGHFAQHVPVALFGR